MESKITGILSILVPKVIEQIIINENISEIIATRNFYLSKTYELLEDENSKLWHLSPKALYEIYKKEKETGELLVPEGV